MRRLSLVLVLMGAMMATSQVRAERIKVLTTGAFKQVVVALIPAYEKRTGNTVELDNDTAGALAKRIDGGETFDALILTPAGIEAYTKSGRIAAGTTAPLASVGVGVAVKKGAPVPEIKTVEQFKQALLAAKKVAYIDPASGGSSGTYLVKLYDQLGITAQIAPKAVLVHGGIVATRLVTGEADIAVHQISEMLHVEGATFVGPLPDEIQSYTFYAGGVSAKTDHRAAAEAFIATLSSPEAAAVIREKGMRPPR